MTDILHEDPRVFLRESRVFVAHNISNYISETKEFQAKFYLKIK